MDNPQGNFSGFHTKNNIFYHYLKIRDGAEDGGVKRLYIEQIKKSVSTIPQPKIMSEIEIFA